MVGGLYAANTALTEELSAAAAKVPSYIVIWISVISVSPLGYSNMSDIGKFSEVL